jgi:hypothetical protein
VLCFWRASYYCYALLLERFSELSCDGAELRLQELLLPPFGFGLDWRVDFIWTGVEPFSGFCVAQKCERKCLGVVSSNTACRWRHSSHRDAQTRNSMRPIGIRYV